LTVGHWPLTIDRWLLGGLSGESSGGRWILDFEAVEFLIPAKIP